MENNTEKYIVVLMNREGNRVMNCESYEEAKNTMELFKGYGNLIIAKVVEEHGNWNF